MLAARLDLLEKKPDVAEQRLLQIVQAQPSRLDAYELLGEIYLKQGQIDSALEKYRAMAGHAPDAAGPPTMIGMILESKGDRDAARKQYRAVLDKHPRAAVAANNLAWMLAEDGQYDEALKLATVATEELRDRPEPQDTLGWIYLQKNLPVHALPAFQRALDLAPSNDLYKKHLEEAQARSAKPNG
jgi:Tfp pilus assembly protein PilF